MIVTIDGPAGAGKSSVARKLAQALGYTYLDTGAMYRAVALMALRHKIALSDAETLAQLARTLPIRFGPLSPDGVQRVWIGEGDSAEEVTEAIRTPEVSQATSIISTHSPVRRALVERQRQMALAAENGVVLEGRDTGTVVVPQAELKIFLTASPQERARRRAAELRAQGLEVSEETILKEQEERDARDSRRTDSPLRPAPDAILLNTDGLDLDAVVRQILSLHQERCNQRRCGVSEA
ncbi:MAG TPA: (d)CMP kinase [Chthonomonas sp.]|uniref:(d)CMP kinase n=1 Tax=Chthonomonas sp. TaxID=2282153 RepID=UPI002B4B40D4|nr:(d)CMP kinase [Chthonomonas sp.]HLI49628.1 (d)CMP kinase [Chthonomonas sp.]